MWRCLDLWVTPSEFNEEGEEVVYANSAETGRAFKDNFDGLFSTGSSKCLQVGGIFAEILMGPLEPSAILQNFQPHFDGTCQKLQSNFIFDRVSC